MNIASSTLYKLWMKGHESSYNLKFFLMSLLKGHIHLERDRNYDYPFTTSGEKEIIAVQYVEVLAAAFSGAA